MTRTMTIEGMMCTHCSGRVEKALNAIPGVTATVDLAAKTATVTGEADNAALRKAVEDAGYTVVSIG
ncbi:MAG: heavy-metal-associated domain-containing protein [Ruminococcaceae bacterium]|nr:heavy-metal-associated domain-containing protein [Oscillospiraceae bacterium]